MSKKDDTYRFCVDFRALNRITVFDAEPKPDVDALFARLSGHKYFSRLDLSKGYLLASATVSSCSSFDSSSNSYGSFLVYKDAFWISYSSSNFLSSYA